MQAGEPSSLNLSLDCRDDYQQVRLFVAPLRATPATLQVSGEVMDAAVEEASCGVAASRGSADLVPLFESFRKQAPPGEIVSLPESRERGLPRLLMVDRSEEHTSELPSLMRISYAVFGSNKKK